MTEEKNKIDKLEELLTTKKRLDWWLLSGGAAVLLSCVCASNDCYLDWSMAKDHETQVQEQSEEIELSPADEPRLIDYEHHVIKASGLHHVDPDILRAMLVASSDYNPNIKQVPPYYRGAVLLDPINAGVTSSHLENHPELAIERAAHLYSLARTDDPTTAIARVIAGEELVGAALAKLAADRNLVDEKIATNYRNPIGLLKLQQEKAKLTWPENIHNEGLRSIIYITTRLCNDPEELWDLYRGL